jgi:hypothetical protein
MKLATLAASLVANLALAGAFALHPTLAPSACRDFIARHSPFVEPSHPIAVAPRAATHVTRAKLWPMLDAGDNLVALVSRLRAAGFPSDVIREMVRAEIDARFAARLRLLTAADPSIPFWKTQSGGLGNDGKKMAEYTALQRERANLQRELFKDPFFASDEISADLRRRFGNLPRQKIDLLQQIEDDYSDMATAIRAATNGILLPDDRAKLALLDREKLADLAAVLSPAELADYQVRSSPLTNMLARQLGGFNPTETEFRTIFDAQNQYSQRMAPGMNIGAGMFSIAGMQSAERQAIQQQLQDALQAGLGPRYAEYVRETDQNYQMLSRLAQKENLPPETALRAFNVRDTVAAESTRIANDPALDGDAKRAALQVLAQTTRSQLLAMLGPTAGPAYVTALDSQWLKSVERGNAMSFTGGPNMSISMGGTSGATVLVAFGASPVFKSVAPPRELPPRP